MRLDSHRVLTLLLIQSDEVNYFSARETFLRADSRRHWYDKDCTTLFTYMYRSTTSRKLDSVAVIETTIMLNNINVFNKSC